MERKKERKGRFSKLSCQVSPYRDSHAVAVEKGAERIYLACLNNRANADSRRQALTFKSWRDNGETEG